MDEFAKSIERKFKLGLSTQQQEEIDSIFQAFMREYHFPKSQPVNDAVLRFKYFRKTLKVLTKEQLNIYRTKKKEEKTKHKIREKKNDEKYLNHLARVYKDANLSIEQLKIIYKTNNSVKEKILDIEERQFKILSALTPTIDDHQRKEIEKIFFNQLKQNRENRAKRTKRKYEYLNLNDDQAKEISILDEKERKQRRKPGYKGLDLYHIKPAFKNILTINQFDLYSAHQEERKEESMKSQIEEDAKKSSEFVDLEERKNFLINNVLPEKCKITSQLLKSANKEDLLRIKELKKTFNDKIDETILIKKNRIEERYGTQLPNHLKLRIIESTFQDINPSPIILEDLDLNKNEFSSIQLNEEQELMLKSLKEKIREYYIKKLEKKLKGSYGGLTTIGRENEIPKYFDLYSLLMLEEELDKNIEKMKIRQRKFGATL